MVQRFVALKTETPADKEEFDDRSVKLKLPTIASDQLGAEPYPTLVSLYCVIPSLKAVLRNEEFFAESLRKRWGLNLVHAKCI
ncbi:hypothetical protein PHMEG_00016537 [Phytophthora megakarya]|uniref:Uncharacterized protein n=1 Tax=Phytophthora megakarya TaxID=4795 RepID=A0A225W155_9STRA|nr:hypothetical protein PHMEG_00016537 [Phytophthora megakarya]